MPNVNFHTVFNGLNNRLDQHVKIHLQNVYATVAIALLSAAAGSFAHLFTPFLKFGVLIGLTSVGLLIALGLTPDNGKNHIVRLSFLTGFAFTSGISLGPMLEMAIIIDPSIIPSAFMGTAVIFICFTLAAVFSDHRKFLYLGGLLMSLLSVSLMLGLANFFFGSKLLFEVNLYLGLLLACGFILFDTQLIIAKRMNGDKDFIWHAVALFIDLFDVFQSLLAILAQKEKRKNSKD